MVEVRALTKLKLAELKQVASGYSSNARYEVALEDSAERVTFELRLVALARPYLKKYDHFDDETIERYNGVLKESYSLGAYDGRALVGVAIAEAHLWNQSLWMHEFHVAETHRGLGIGRRLMDRAVEKAKQAELRTIVCETQNTNVAAIRFYRGLGFRIEGIDISHYSNADYPGGEMAIFMKRRLK